MKLLMLQQAEQQTLRDMGVFHPHPRVRIRSQAIVRFSLGLTLQQTANEFHVHLNSIEVWRQRWNKQRLMGLYEGRHTGRKRKWTAEQQEAPRALAQADGGSAKRNMAAAKRLFDKAMRENGVPDRVAMEKSGANKATIDAVNAGRDVPIEVRQVKCLNNIVEQDHRAIKRVTRPMLNFKSFRGAGSVLAGIELMHMIRKGQFAINGTDAMSFADQFYALAGKARPQ